MSSLSLLFFDELKGFAKSKVMLALWVGLPLLALAMHYLAPSSGTVEGDIPFSTFTALIISSISGTLASAMLAVSLIHERSRHVYELYLIRPLKRRDILLAKFLAVYVGLAVAALLAIGTGLAFDFINLDGLPSSLLTSTAEALAISLSMMAMASAVGVLIGVISGSVLLGVILVIYGGNQLVTVVMLPLLMEFSGRSIISFAGGIVLALGLLYVAILVFKRQQF